MARRMGAHIMYKLSSPAHKLLAALLTVELALGGVPARVWADEASEVPPSPQEVEVVATGADSLDENSEGSDGQLVLTEEATPELEQEAVAPEDEPSTDSDGATAAALQEATDPLAAPSQQETDALEADDATELSVTASVIGIDDAGNTQVWAASQAYKVAEGSTAADVTEALFEKTGLAHDSGNGEWGYFLNTITSPDGARTLGWDESTGRYWQLFVNGAVSSSGASGVTLQEGDSICWCYSAWGDELPAELQVAFEVIGPDGSWRSSTSLSMAQGTTAADLTERGLEALGLAHESSNGEWGYSLDSITGPDGKSLAFDPDTWDYWQLFVNGATSEVGASSVELSDGMSVTWYYSGFGESIPEANTVTATCEVVGPNGEWSVKRELTLDEGATAADLTKQAFEAAGLTYESSETSWGWSLDSITGPDGKAIAMDPVTWDYWRLFVDGALSDSYADGVALKSGMSVVWSYGAYGAGIPDPTDVKIDPDATRPAYEAEWSGYKGTDLTGNVTAETPTDAAELVWSVSMLPEGKQGQFINTSDPIIVNGDIYLVADGVLYKRSAATGEVKGQAPLAAPTSYTSRIRYADGIILVPLEGGRVQAITADALATVWVSDEVPELPGWDGKPAAQQNSSTVLTHDGYAYLGTTDGTGNGGNLLCISLATGATRWSHTSASGYYWAGCAMTDAGLVVSNDAGILCLFDPMEGTVLATLDLGSRCRASIVAADGSTVYAVTTDGMLHKVNVSEGTVAEQAKVKFANGSTTTPTIVEGKMVVAGSTDQYKGTLSIVDLATMSVEQTVTAVAGNAESTPIPGDIKSAPLVAKTSDGVYVYFTANTLPGSLYALKLGEALAHELYAPAEAAQNYCMSSPIADANGTLYYINDSATLFALRASTKTPDNPPEPDNPVKPDDKSKDDGKGEEKPGDAGKKDDSKKSDSDSSSQTTKKSAFIQVSGNSSGTAATASKTKSTTSSKATSNKSTKNKSDSKTDKKAKTTKKDQEKATTTASNDSGQSQPEVADAVTTIGAADSAVAGTGNARRLPLWPIVGMGCGIGAILWALLGRRRKEEEDE